MRPGSDEIQKMMDDEFLEIEPLNSDQFLKVRETLTRIGLPGRVVDSKPVLWQTAHVLQKRGRYFICHFKQLFALDGNMNTTITDEDYDRVEFIAFLLQQWGLVKNMYDIQRPNVNVMIIPFKDKSQWDLRAKYTIGSKHDGGEANNDHRIIQQ